MPDFLLGSDGRGTRPLCVAQATPMTCTHFTLARDQSCGYAEDHCDVADVRSPLTRNTSGCSDTKAVSRLNGKAWGGTWGLSSSLAQHPGVLCVHPLPYSVRSRITHKVLPEFTYQELFSSLAWQGTVHRTVWASLYSYDLVDRVSGERSCDTVNDFKVQLQCSSRRSTGQR